MRHLRLRHKIQLMFLLGSLGLCIVMPAAFLYIGNQEAKFTIFSEVQTTSSLLSGLIQERSSHLEHQTDLVAEMPEIGTSINDPVSANKNLERFAASLGFQGVWLTNANGYLVGSAGGSAVGITPSQIKGIPQALQGLGWSGIIMRPEGVLLAHSTPVRQNGIVVGTLTTFNSLDRGVTSELRDFLKADLAFMRGASVISSTIELESALPTRPAEPKKIEIGGVPYLVQYAPLPGTSKDQELGFVVIHNYDRAIAKYRNVSYLFLVLMAAGLPLLLITVARFSRRISRPLEQTADALQVIERGQWPEPFETDARDEIGKLQRGLNDMVKALRTSQERLVAMIDLDPLTELFNHRSFKEKLLDAADEAAQRKVALSALFVDLDNFAEVNNKIGPNGGDQVIKHVGRLLRAMLPEGGIASRYGGEEFAVLLPGVDSKGAEAWGQQLCERVRKIPCATAITVSVGCAQWRPEDEPESLILAAELAASQAKQLGRDQVCSFELVPGAGDATPGSLNKYLKDGSLATIQALAAAVDAKDAYTNGHSLRVAEYAVLLARALGASPDVVDLVYRAGTLHDVGKIGVPDHILKKPDRLTDEERAIMETHPVLGEVIVRKVPALEDCVGGVRSHHERWDGKGYPDGISGEAIPWVARVLAVSDTYDAMSSDRPYRKGLDKNFSLDEIEKGAGTQFDPVMAKKFVEVIRDLMNRAA